jgi:hypothetical protein
MKLSDFDLQQLSETRLLSLPAQQKDALLVKLLADLKEARERLKANSRTSSRPPSSDPPWSSDAGTEESESDPTLGSAAGVSAKEGEDSAAEQESDAVDTEETPAEVSAAMGKPPARKKAGRQEGMKGYGRVCQPFCVNIFRSV